MKSFTIPAAALVLMVAACNDRPAAPPATSEQASASALSPTDFSVDTAGRPYAGPPCFDAQGQQTRCAPMGAYMSRDYSAARVAERTTEFARLDANRDNAISRDELTVRAREDVGEMLAHDRNRDGRVTGEEMYPGDGVAADLRFQWDRDRNGVSEDEGVAQYMRSFDQQDRDGNGSLSRQEYTTRPPVTADGNDYTPA